jgi:rhodanese-related sulfurtransferase
MKRYLSLVLVLAVWIGVSTSCTKDNNNEPVIQTNFEKLTTYMVDNGMDLPDVTSGWIKMASDLVGHESDYFVVDIRSTTLFEQGHIPGAHNCPTLADIVTYVETNNTGNLPVIIACYTGQSACRAVVALRLSGYPDAQSLAFGMSAWATEFDHWTSACTDTAIGNANWSTAAAPTLMNNTDRPTIDATATDGAGILAERVDYMLTKGGWGVNALDVLASPTDYSIFNYWGATDYSTYGHIAGAYQLTPGELKIADNGLNILDPVGTNVTYCWTGQTSSMVTAWLDVLGYDAMSLRYGANGMIFTNLMAHQWAGPGDYTMETGS